MRYGIMTSKGWRQDSAGFALTFGDCREAMPHMREGDSLVPVALDKHPYDRDMYKDQRESPGSQSFTMKTHHQQQEKTHA